MPNSAFFSTTDFATPATYVNAAGSRTDVDAIFDSEYLNSSLGGAEVENARKVAFVQSSLVADYSKGAKLIKHAMIETDDGSGYVTDHLGQPIVAENIATWYIVEKHDDAEGISMLVLSTDPVQ